MYFRFIFRFHKPVKYSLRNVSNNIGEHSLDTNLVMSYHDKLKSKMTSVFENQIGELSTELQGILIDDMVTAFESRFKVLNRVDLTRRFQY